MYPASAKRCGVLALWVLTTLPLCADDLSELRRWTSSDGRSLTARFLKAEADSQTVKLKRSDGYIFTLDWEQLSEADQKRLLAYCETTEAKGSRAIEAPSTPPERPRKLELEDVPMVVQKENYCVPASATMIAGFHGVETNQDQVAKLSSKGSETKQGTYPSDMLLAMNKLGFTGAPMHWKDDDEFLHQALPRIKETLFKTGPVYISFKPGAFGPMGHGCVIVGYDDRKEELLFYNPWGNEFAQSYQDVSDLGYGVVFISPPKAFPVATETLLATIRKACAQYPATLFEAVQQLDRSKINYELIWCNRHDERDNRKFADNTAKRDGRNILELAFERNPAVIIPYSPKGQVEHYLLVTRPTGGGARFEVRSLGPSGWVGPELFTLGSLTREWPTLLTVPNQEEPIWELPLIEIKGIRGQ